MRVMGRFSNSVRGGSANAPVLTLPILVPVLLGVALLVAQPKGRRVRSIYVTAATVVTSILSSCASWPPITGDQTP